MKFSLFYEMQISRPTRETEAQLFRDCVDQCVLADEIGYHAIWEVEHHGLYEYSHSSAPETFLAYIAAKTERIRLGHGITLTPYRYNHPIRIAERVATLDILSGGRVNWGSGKSSSMTEKLAFENDVDQLHAQWEEALDMIPRMWREDVFSYKGRFFDIPPTRVIPKPVQQPHPPMFAACSKPESAVQVGKLGIGALNFAIGNDDYLARKVREYRAAVAAAQPEAYAKTDHFACTPVALCLPDDREACRYGFRGANFFAQALAAYYFTADRPIGPLPIDRDFLSDEDLAAAMAFRGAEDAPAMNVIGDPVHCREIVSRFRDAGVDELILVMQAGTVPHELVMRSIRTFGEQVMPYFADSPPARPADGAAALH
ncbi:MAG: LLM class flavin-dependent oxidoreductase [Deltaproteobacteria bacterium]|nr:MAG: LLM class flavin-dependent oxidoreductase [Deltaproteobacteria bacterium]